MRVRDILHPSGCQLRIGLDRGLAGEPMMVQLSDPASRGTQPILLDLYGTELLAGFVMSARLAAIRGGLADERCDGLLPCEFRLVGKGRAAVIELRQQAESLAVPQQFWDRLYAELMLALAHGRHLADSARMAPPAEGSGGMRLLH